MTEASEVEDLVARPEQELSSDAELEATVLPNGQTASTAMPGSGRVGVGQRGSVRAAAGRFPPSHRLFWAEHPDLVWWLVGAVAAIAVGVWIPQL